MNIFVVDLDPVVAAQALCDKHVVKMTLETAQILAAVSARYGVAGPYKPTHAKHPCTLWAGDSHANWQWTVVHGLTLADEYTRRYGKRHASHDVVKWYLVHGGAPRSGRATPFAQAMPEQYRADDAVAAYRAYYRGEKSRIATWREPAAPPSWFTSAA